jgi:hypothetical protein
MRSSANVHSAQDACPASSRRSLPAVNRRRRCRRPRMTRRRHAPAVRGDRPRAAGRRRAFAGRRCRYRLRMTGGGRATAGRRAGCHLGVAGQRDGRSGQRGNEVGRRRRGRRRELDLRRPVRGPQRVIERKVRNRSKPEPAEQDRDEPRQEEEEDETPGTPHPARTPAARVLEDPWLLKGRLHGISLPTSENFHVSSAEETVFPPRVLFDCALNRRHLPREERGLRAVRNASATRLDFRRSPS